MTEDELKSFCSKRQLNYCLCSAKDGTNIDECINKLTPQILNNEILMKQVFERETYRTNPTNTNDNQQESCWC